MTIFICILPHCLKRKKSTPYSDSESPGELYKTDGWAWPFPTPNSLIQWVWIGLKFWISKKFLSECWCCWSRGHYLPRSMRTSALQDKALVQHNGPAGSITRFSLSLTLMFKLLHQPIEWSSSMLWQQLLLTTIHIIHSVEMIYYAGIYQSLSWIKIVLRIYALVKTSTVPGMYWTFTKCNVRWISLSLTGTQKNNYLLLKTKMRGYFLYKTFNGLSKIKITTLFASLLFGYIKAPVTLYFIYLLICLFL